MLQNNLDPEVAERAQGAQQGVEGLPRPCRPTGSAVHDEVVGTFGDLRIEVVLEHPESGLLRPASARQLRPPRRADRAGTLHAATLPHWGRTGGGCQDGRR